jgi:hypothetical protein
MNVQKAFDIHNNWLIGTHTGVNAAREAHALRVVNITYINNQITPGKKNIN